MDHTKLDLGFWPQGELLANGLGNGNLTSFAQNLL
jgi:hypothetical protein